jgi:hypothetical protein
VRPLDRAWRRKSPVARAREPRRGSKAAHAEARPPSTGLRSIQPAGYSRCPIGFVEPGAEILLRISGWPKVNEVLRAIDAIEQTGIAPEEACPDHWRHVMNRLAAGEQPRAYTRERHRAWLLRRRIDA